MSLLPSFTRTARLLGTSLLLLTAGLALMRPAQAVAADWQKQTMQEISAELPTALAPGPDVMGSLPEQVKKLIQSYEIKQAQDGAEFVVVLARIEYKEEVSPSVDGAANGAMTQAAKAMGDADPKYDIKKTTVDGLEARRASYHNKVNGQDIHMEALLALDGKKIYQAQIIFTSAERVKDAERIISSLHFNKK